MKSYPKSLPARRLLRRDSLHYGTLTDWAKSGRRAAIAAPPQAAAAYEAPRIYIPAFKG
jgi:hypothetical protein